MFACPMKVESALMLTPAAIQTDANVWRHSCGLIGSSPAAFHARSARFRRDVPLNRRPSSRAKARASGAPPS